MYVYLLHFDRPICPTRTTQHYLGSTSNLEKRLQRHRQGIGSRLCAVAKERGIEFQLADVFIGFEEPNGHRQLERTFKRRRHHPRLCPICSKQ